MSFVLLGIDDQFHVKVNSADIAVASTLDARQTLPAAATVVVVLLVCALSVASSIFLILEMNRPFEGLMRISSTPLRYALSRMGR